MWTFTRRAVLTFILAAPIWPAAAQDDYPNKPITIVVGAAPGGPNDIVARLLGERMGQNMNATFVVENRGGGGGVIASRYVAQAAPDGYVLQMGAVSTHGINPTLYKNLGYDALKDFTPISAVVKYPLVLVVNPAKVPAKTVAEYIDYARDRPGELNRASAGNGSSMHLAGELFDSMAGTKTSHVPFRGSAPAVQALLAGDVDVDFESILVSLPHIQSGRLQALGVTGTTRSSVLPDVPVIAETVPGYELNGWLGLVAPANTPPAIVDRLAREVAIALEDQELRKKLLDQAIEPFPSRSPQDFTDFIKSEIDKLGKVVRASGVSVD